MGLMDSARQKAQELAKNNPDKVEQLSDQAIEKAGNAADARTGGKHTDKIDQAQRAINDRIGD